MFKIRLPFISEKISSCRSWAGFPGHRHEVRNADWHRLCCFSCWCCTERRGNPSSRATAMNSSLLLLCCGSWWARSQNRYSSLPRQLLLRNSPDHAYCACRRPVAGHPVTRVRCFNYRRDLAGSRNRAECDASKRFALERCLLLVPVFLTDTRVPHTTWVMTSFEWLRQGLSFLDLLWNPLFLGIAIQILMLFPLCIASISPQASWHSSHLS